MGCLITMSDPKYNRRGSATARYTLLTTSSGVKGTYGGTKVTHAQGTLALRSGLVYTWHNIDMYHSVAFANFDDKLSAYYKAGRFQIFGKLDFKHQATEQFAIEPYANLLMYI